MKSNSELLSRLVQEERKLDAPAIDWDAVEARLIARLETEPRTFTPKRRVASRWPILVLAAAGALALGAVWRQRHSPAPVAKNAATETSSHWDAAKVAIGTRLAAGSVPIVVEHEGRASWILRPGSAAVLTKNSELIQIDLVEGTLEASVVPSAVPETFVVMAGDVRIAVHGTRFSVKRGKTTVTVSVREGVVTAAGVGREPVRISATESAVFDAEGAIQALDQSRSIAATPKHLAAQKTLAPGGERAPEPQASEANEPTIAEVETGVSRIVSAVNGCFAQHTPTATDVKVTVRTTMSFSVDPNGAVSTLGFEPPLAPAVQACSNESLASVRFARSVKGIEVSRVLELER